MSISAVESRIGQIMAMQQQLSDPAALAASQNATDTSAATGGASGASAPPASFSDALTSALASAATGTTAGQDVYTDPAMDASLIGANRSSGALSAPAQVQAMINMANSLSGKPYIYGGGHSGWGPQAGYDCSGFVSAVLHAGGYLSAPQNTQTLPGQPGIEPGPGQYVTMYDRNTGPTANEHVIIEIDGQFYESGGEAGAWGGGGGVEKIGTPSQAYLSSFTTILHPAGL